MRARMTWSGSGREETYGARGALVGGMAPAKATGAAGAMGVATLVPIEAVTGAVTGAVVGAVLLALDMVAAIGADLAEVSMAADTHSKKVMEATVRADMRVRMGLIMDWPRATMEVGMIVTLEGTRATEDIKAAMDVVTSAAIMVVVAVGMEHRDRRRGGRSSRGDGLGLLV